MSSEKNKELDESVAVLCELNEQKSYSCEVDAAVLLQLKLNHTKVRFEFDSKRKQIVSIIVLNNNKQEKEKYQMNINMILCSLIGVMFLCAGCGDRKLGEECDAEMSKRHGVMRMFENKVCTHQVLGAECEVDFNTYDELYYQCYRKSFQNSDKYISKIGSASSFAFAKRKAALEMSREVFCYSFWNYLCLDGVSGFIYNVSYIMQIPHKMLRGLRAMDGIWRYIKSLFYLLFGLVLALVGCIVAPIVNTLCHPFETISNLLVGVVSACADVDSPVSWIEYVWRTNIIASLWDLIWGGIIYPLWQALIFWL